jgi:tRNA modification GTPase
MILDYNDTICALSTANGVGAIAVIRISGSDTFSILDKIFSKNLIDKASHTTHFGVVKDKNGVLIDEVLVNIFKNPHSFTGEDVAEISCHGSVFIQQRLLEVIFNNGARMAKPGEFSMRAFANGKFDLSQAEAIGDLISSSTEASHKLAMQQMRGGFSNEISFLREQMMNFASLIELELDFSEEDVEFADRKQFYDLLEVIGVKLEGLIKSFSYGNVIKNGVPISIIGAPNAGKSTLLNRLLNEDKAIVSDIAGTTRDIVEDEIIINGISFRFIDTAGIRETTNEIEQIGIKKAIERAKKSEIVIYLFDAKDDVKGVEKGLALLKQEVSSEIVLVANKVDLIQDKSSFKHLKAIELSATTGKGVDNLVNTLIEIVNAKKVEGQQIIITNMRHVEALQKAFDAIIEVKQGLDNGITGDFLAIDIRQSLHYLGEITGEITTDDLLGNIFGKFCIGK